MSQTLGAHINITKKYESTAHGQKLTCARFSGKACMYLPPLELTVPALRQCRVSCYQTLVIAWFLLRRADRAVHLSAELA